MITNNENEPAERVERAELADLIGDWESIYQGYLPGDPDEVVQETVNALDRARSAQPRDPQALAFYTFGLVFAHNYVSFGDAPAELGRQVAASLTAVATDPALTEAPCPHEAHPYEDDLDTHLNSTFEALLTLMTGSTEDYAWEDLADATGAEADPESAWRCPRNVAGFAGVAAEEIE